MSISNIKHSHSQEIKVDNEDNVSVSGEDEQDEQDVVTKAQPEDANTSKLRYSVVTDGYRIVLRKKPKVIRYVHYSEKVHSEKHFREQLMLFHPWRNEEVDLLNGFETFEAHYKSIEKQILSKKAEYDASLELIDEIEAAMEAAPLDNFDEVCPNIESIEANDTQQEPVPSTSFAFYSPQSHDHAYHDLGPDIELISPPRSNDVEIVQNRLPEREYIKLLSTLNEMQRDIFTHIVHSLSKKPEQQLCVFITGGAGVGKSVVIKHCIGCSVPNQGKTLMMLGYCFVRTRDLQRIISKVLRCTLRSVLSQIEDSSSHIFLTINEIP